MESDSDIRRVGEIADVTDYVANGSFAALKQHVQYLDSDGYAVLVRLVDFKSGWKGNCTFVGKESYDFLRKSSLQPGDVVISNVGANAGTVFRVPDLGRPMTLGPNSIVIKTAGNEALRDYLYYYFISRYGQSQIQTIMGGSAQPKFNKTDFRSLSIRVPRSAKLQKAIGHILGTLDDKIELNRRMNETLEAMAQALFKSWFVDFDPVIDKALAAGHPIPEPLQKRAEARKGLGNQRKPLPASIAQHFPDRFVFNEQMGWVPEGWEDGILENLLVLQRGFDLPKSQRTAGRFPLMVASGQDGTHSDYKVKGPGVTTGRSGKLGIVSLILQDFWPLNTTLWVKEFRRSSPYHALHLLRQLSLERFNAGSAVPTLNRNHVHNIPVTIPPVHLIETYTDMVAPFFVKILENSAVSSSMSSLRDTLLPKLLSGELRISEAEKLAEEAL